MFKIMSAIHLTWGDLPPALFPLVVVLVVVVLIARSGAMYRVPATSPRGVLGRSLLRHVKAAPTRAKSSWGAGKRLWGDAKYVWGATKLFLRDTLPPWLVNFADWLWKDWWHGVSVAGFLAAFSFTLGEVIWHGWDGVQEDDALWYLFTVLYLWTWLGYSAVSHLSTGIRYLGAAVGLILSLSIVLGLLFSGLPAWPAIVILVAVFGIGAIGSAANRSRWGVWAMVLAYGLYLLVRGMVWVAEKFWG